MTRKYICPTCRQKSGIAIAYGYPSAKLIAKAEAGEIDLGGCIIEPNQPDRRCTACGAEWQIKRKEQIEKTSFEEAKQKWLKEVVKGRSWVQMMDDKDKADDEKVKASMTPEYLAMWKKAEKDYDEGAD